MKIIKAKQLGQSRIAYINADRIDSFHSVYDNINDVKSTKIYIGQGKCEIEGDKTLQIAQFMSTDDNCGFLDLVDVENSAYRKAHERFAKGVEHVTAE